MESSVSAQTYTTGFVTSKDGTTIGYRQIGHGPGLILIHGGMQASQNFMKLAAALADVFTVYIPDRRGRGLSGPHGDHYSLDRECEDIDALLQKTGTHAVFALSSGAIIALQAALILPAIHQVALYEPPLSINHSTPVDWLARYDREIAQGQLGSAMLTAIRGTQTAPPPFRFIPRFVLAPLLNRAAKIGSEVTSKHEAQNNKVTQGEEVPLSTLVPTMHYDVQLVIESEGRLENFKAVPAEVLLLGGSKSPRYLKTTLDALEKVLPHVRRVEFSGVDHLAADNSGQPERVAQELRSFFNVRQPVKQEQNS